MQYKQDQLIILKARLLLAILCHQQGDGGSER